MSTLVCGTPVAFRTRPPLDAIAQLLGQRPVRASLVRTHFPGKRPVQMTFSAELPGGDIRTVLAEYCPDGADAHEKQITASLRKSRNGQRDALQRTPVVVDPQAGLVLRQPGLDERLPGLRLLYDTAAARDVLASALGRDPGPVQVQLAAHRLGKRAVLRIGTQSGTIFARLRGIKSSDGTSRLSRHRTLWNALGQQTDLRIPEPLGSAAELGVAFFSALPGRVPVFDATDAGVVDRALRALQKLDPDGLPVHGGADEAALLQQWHARCRDHLPDLAAAIASKLDRTCAELAACADAGSPCHRDLHEAQILIHDGCAGLLDFDTLSLAHPSLDAGNLLAHLFLARRDERPLQEALAGAEVALWRRAALLRLAMIYAFTSTPAADIDRLMREAAE